MTNFNMTALERESIRLEILFLEQRLRMLKAKLFEAESKPVPQTVPYPQPPVQPAWRNDMCYRCGRSFKDPLSVVCTDINCPCGLGPVMCSTGCVDAK